MFKRILFFIFIIVTVLATTETIYSWGFYGHKRINRMAVFTLPSDMILFYKNHIEFITEHAVDPDKRRYANKLEAPRHYIDVDYYGKDWDTIVPKQWKKAVEKFSEDTLQAYGIVPWHIEKMLQRLTDAFKKEDLDQILYYSSDLGHYIGDAHVPLHTTENYNGQLTNQKGIHGFWESRLPELTADDFDYFVGKAKYIDNVNETVWSFITVSHAAVDSVLKFEAMLNDEFPKDRKYSYENKGASIMKTYSKEYSLEYNKLMNGMVERRMRSAIIMVGSFWYTAWVNAGQPNLSRLENKEVTDSLKKVMNEEELLWKTGRLAGSGKGHDD